MRERAATLLLIVALFLIVGIDITPIFISDTSILLSHKLSYFESGVDASVVLLVYMLLKRELNFRTRVLHMAAHDLRNPLGVIRGYAEIILDNPALPADQQEMTKHILTKSDEILQLVNDLLDSAVLARRKVIIDRRSVPLIHVVRETIDEFQPQCARKNQNIALVEEAPDLHVWADFARMKQVCANLISNALKYSPPDSEVQICLGSRDNRIRLSVRDAGHGLTPDEIKLIFESFSTVKKPTTGGETSTGIGLSISKTLVEMHEGKIWAESGGKGQGSTFFVELPSRPS